MFVPTYPNSSVAEPKPKLDISAVVVIVVVVDMLTQRKERKYKNIKNTRFCPSALLPLIDRCFSLFRSFANAICSSVSVSASWVIVIAITT